MATVRGSRRGVAGEPRRDHRPSRDPVYASGFFTVVLGAAPVFVGGRLGLGGASGGGAGPPAAGAPCRSAGGPRRRSPAGRTRLTMSRCVLVRAPHRRACRRVVVGLSRATDPPLVHPGTRHGGITRLLRAHPRVPGGPHRDDFTDVWFYGMQITLQDRPDEVPAPRPRGSRHFGVTLGRDEFEAVIARLPPTASPGSSRSRPMRGAGHQADEGQDRGTERQRRRDSRPTVTSMRRWRSRRTRTRRPHTRQLRRGGRAPLRWARQQGSGAGSDDRRGVPWERRPLEEAR